MNQSNTQQQQQQLQLKSRQVASATNNTSSNNNNPGGAVASQAQQNSLSKTPGGSKPTHKKSQSTASATVMYMQQQIMPTNNYSYQQQQSHNSTPKGSSTSQQSSYGAKKQQHQQQLSQQQQQQHYLQNQVVPSQKYVQQQQQQQPFDNRKRSTEVNVVGSGMVYNQYPPQQQVYNNNGQVQAMLIQSKSTKVSPQRIAKQVQNNLPITQKLGSAFDGVQQKQLNSMDTTSGVTRGGGGVDQHPHPNISASHMNTYQYFNFDMDGIPQNLVSHTTGPKQSQKKDMAVSRGSMPGVILPNNLIPQGSIIVNNGAANADDMNMESSMHQSFINLIYPSKSKKLMSNEAAVNASYPNSGSQTLIPPQSTAQPGHHKSKSLYVGGGSSNVAPPTQNHIVQNFVKPVAHQLAPKGGLTNNSQKANFKKQQNIFTYSQRFKELLNDTMVEEQQQLQKSVGPTQQQQSNNLFSNQQSPSQSMLQSQYMNIPQTHIMVNFGDIQLKQRSVILPPDAHQKGTFDNKPLTSHTTHNNNANNQYLTLHENQALQNASANKTIDYTHVSSLAGGGGGGTYGKVMNQHNTPNSSHPGKASQKSKFSQDPPPPSKTSSTTLHQRKPSHPVTNNYMLELLQSHQQQPQAHQQQNPMLSSIQGQQQFTEKAAPLREKKQHQPTQSKKSAASTNGSASNNTNNQQQHQRSVSDYIHYQNDNKMLRFINNESDPQQQQYEQMMIESFEGNLEVANNGQHQQHQGLDSYRGNGQQPMISAALQNFMQQDFSQMLYDGGNNQSSAQQLSHRQSYPEPSAATKQTYVILNQGTSSLTQEPNKNSNYHFRKMSVQQQPSSQLNARKSPSKQSKIVVHSSNSNNIDNTGNYQKLAQKRRSSPHGSSGMTDTNGLLLQHSNNFINTHAAHNKSIQQQQKQQPKYPQTAGPSIRTSQVTSPSNKVKQQQQPTTIISHHSSSATAIHNNLFNMPQQQQPQYLVGHTRSNSDLMKQQILNAQANALKKPQQQRPNPAINTTPMGLNGGGQKAKSEMTTPRQQQAKKKAQVAVGSGTIQQQQLQPTNVSIDLVTSKSKQPQQPVVVASQHSNLQKNSSASNLQPSTLKRKDSSSKPYDQQQTTPRLLKTSPQQQQQIKPPATSKVGNNNSISSSSAHQHPTTQNVAPSGVGKQRYSMQNSPRQQQQYNISQQYQMFQQAMAKQGSGNGNQKQQQYYQNKTETVSPINNAKSSGSFVQQQQNNPLMRASVGQLQQPTSQVLNQSKSGFLEEILETSQNNNGGHRRGVSETEYLLNQIRNNINTLKAYQPYQPPNVGPILDNPHQAAFIEPPSKPKHQQPKEEKKQIFNEDKYPKYKRDNLQLPAEVTIQSSLPCDQNLLQEQQQLAYQPLATDPNMSPYSKDLTKLQKLIKINFRKFSEPPATTSEFYRIGRVLGRGAFGKVNLAAHKISEQLVAIKSINKEFLRSSKQQKEGAVVVPAEGGEHPEKKKVMQEFAILKQSNHQSVVRLYDTFETTKHICFVMELCAGGDLLTYVRKRRKLTEEVAKYFFKQLIEGLAYLHHSKLIVHRDIKLDNILLDANGKIKIADFGVSRQVHSDTERMSEQCGTPAYIAPEILKDKGYEGFKVDVWSAGVCLYAMLIGTVPFKASSMQELHHLIINGKYDVHNPNAYNQTQNKDGQATATATTQPQQQTKLTEHAVNLIHSLLQVDPRKRLSAVEVLSHPWLKDSKDELDVFTQKEKDVIHKEYLAKNIDRIYSQITSKQKDVSKDLNGTGMLMFHDTEVIFTEHNLDTKTNVGSLLKNASTKSIILAPFNSTVSEIAAVDEEGKEKPYIWPEDVRKLIVPKKVLKFAPKVKDLDRQYEHNNNADLDNGVYNNVGNEDENNPLNGSNNSSQSNDSLKGSFKETELSSDDERAELQLEEARKRQKMQQETELQEFEKQIKLKYVRYQEPVEIIDTDLVSHIGQIGIYPRDYIMKTLQMKEMNYATACYHLLLKKQQFLAKQQITQMQEEIEQFQPRQQHQKSSNSQLIMGMMSGGEDTGPVKMIPMY